MKKLTLLFMLTIFGLTTYSCVTDDDTAYVDYDTYPVAYDLNNVNFEYVNGVYQIARTFNNPMYDTDMLLMYMKTGNTNNGSPIWQQIPITLYLSDGHEVDYNFDFSKYDFVIYAGGTFDLTGTQYVNNKTFRVLIVPASYAKNTSVDFSNYQSVVDYFHINDSNPKAL